MGEGSTPAQSGYGDLAAWYRLLFPLSPGQETFFSHLRMTGEVSPVLDIGAGVGEQLDWFVARGIQGAALEPDPGMFRQLEARRWAGPAPQLVPAGIEHLAGRWRGRFGLVLCLGNTLPHLAGAGSIRAALAAMRAVTRAGGRLALQTVNFDRIMAEGKAVFPVIERRTPRGTMVRFHRSYDLSELPRRILLSVRLEVGDMVSTAAWPLTPVTKDDLSGWLRSAGFASVEAYGNYDFSPFDAASPALITLSS